MHAPKSTFVIHRITAMSRNGKLGYYVPEELMDLVVENPNAFYSILRNSFAEHSQLQQIPEDQLKRVYKCGKEWKLDAPPPRASIKI